MSKTKIKRQHHQKIKDALTGPQMTDEQAQAFLTALFAQDDADNSTDDDIGDEA
jgi:hypothetical protein